ncbi:MAG: VOC family protein [Bryobacterales bacterium]|nr:VOC family protein [Bryobacterales bacterium]
MASAGGVPLTVKGILETALYVADIHKAAAFYQRIFGFPALLESERLIALDVAGRDVLLLFPVGATLEPLMTEGGLIPSHGAQGNAHFAFAIEQSDADQWRERLVQEGVAIESVVHWAEGAESIYFRDLDGHVVELMSRGFWKVW